MRVKCQCCTENKENSFTTTQLCVYIYIYIYIYIYTHTHTYTKKSTESLHNWTNFNHKQHWKNSLLIFFFFFFFFFIKNKNIEKFLKVRYKPDYNQQNFEKKFHKLFERLFQFMRRSKLITILNNNIYKKILKQFLYKIRLNMNETIFIFLIDCFV